MHNFAAFSILLTRMCNEHKSFPFVPYVMVYQDRRSLSIAFSYLQHINKHLVINSLKSHLKQHVTSVQLQVAHLHKYKYALSYLMLL
jgi:hypothetical protein